MSEQKTHNLAEIEELLASRQQLIGWLERLDQVGSRAPEPVKSKVRSDYRARLAQIVSQLSTHSDLIGSTLEGLRAQIREFRQLRAEEREIRAEAELRHAVGEYTDDEWQLVELESSGKIGELDQEIERLSVEAQRLEEVLSLISGGEAKTPDEPSEPAPLEAAAEPEPVEQPALKLVKEPEEAQAPQPRPEAPRFVPRGGAGLASKQRDSGSLKAMPQPAHAPSGAPIPEEIAFLRSVSLDPNAARGQHQPSGVTPGEPADGGSQAVVAKTLKCAECGSLNRPTEWYCERCGAELAAL